MSFFGAVRLLVGVRSLPPTPPRAPTRIELPPEMARGAWAAWASVNRGATPRPDAAQRSVGLGDACRTERGREGRFVEILEGDRRMLICQEA
jgi:hypothetical protein